MVLSMSKHARGLLKLQYHAQLKTIKEKRKILAIERQEVVNNYLSQLKALRGINALPQDSNSTA